MFLQQEVFLLIIYLYKKIAGLDPEIQTCKHMNTHFILILSKYFSPVEVLERQIT